MGLARMGNMFARRQEIEPEGLPVHVGSHPDTRPTGGECDGIPGVLDARDRVHAERVQYQDENPCRGQELNERREFAWTQFAMPQKCQAIRTAISSVEQYTAPVGSTHPTAMILRPCVDRRVHHAIEEILKT